MRTVRLAVVLWLPALAMFSFTSSSRRTSAGEVQANASPDLHDIAAAVSAARVEADIARLVAFGTRSSISDARGGTRGVGAARDWIADQFRAYSRESGGRLTVELDSFDVPAGPRIPAPLRMTNVVATLPGSDAADHRIFVVGGHYDSIPSFPGDILNPRIDAPGANDDGSGTTVVLECARVLSRYRLPATLRFVAFEGEEQGLYGSTHAAKKASAAGEQIAGMLNNDIVGGDNTAGHENRDVVRVFSEGVPANIDAAGLRRLQAVGGENDSPSRELARFAEERAREYVPAFHVQLEYRRDRYLRGGDHIPFNEAGYAAVRFTDYYENYDHQHQTVRVENGRQFGDLPRFTTAAFTANVARVDAVALAALAASLPPPANVRFAPKLQSGTTLTWDAVPGASGYHVLLRETDAPTWQRRVTASGTSIDLPQSKDNFFMAVAAVGSDGREGLPSLPGLPRRTSAPAATTSTPRH